MNEMLLEEPVLPQPTESFLSFTNSGFFSYFIVYNGTLKEIRRMKWPLVELIRNITQR